MVDEITGVVQFISVWEPATIQEFTLHSHDAPLHGGHVPICIAKRIIIQGASRFRVFII